MINKNKGITLLALIITVIVMMILAGVTLSMLFGEEGVVTKGRNAAMQTEKKSIHENVLGLITYFEQGGVSLDATWENIQKHYDSDVTLISKQDTLLKIKVKGKRGEYEYEIEGRGEEIVTGDAYAILVDDGSGKNTYIMYFIRSEEEVSVGQKYKNKEIKYVYDGIEDESFSPYLSEWYGNKDKITSIVFDNIIQPKSTAFWFYYMKNCTSIDLAKLRTQEVKDMSKMFYYCEKLTTLGDLSSWNTSKVEDMDGLFEGCKKLTYIGKLNNWDTSKVYSFSNMFDYCENLTDIGDLSNWDTSNLGGTYSMFRGCEKLNYIGDLSNWNVSKVLNMSNMFHSCRNIKTLGDLSNWNTQKVWNMSSMFFDCIKLETLGDLSNWNTSNVKEMIWMFGMLYEKDTNYIINVDCSKWNVEKVTKYGCFNQYAPNITPPNWKN